MDAFADMRNNPSTYYPNNPVYSVNNNGIDSYPDVRNNWKSTSWRSNKNSSSKSCSNEAHDGSNNNYRSIESFLHSSGKSYDFHNKELRINVYDNHKKHSKEIRSTSFSGATLSSVTDLNQSHHYDSNISIYQYPKSFQAHNINDGHNFHKHNPKNKGKCDVEDSADYSFQHKINNGSDHPTFVQNHKSNTFTSCIKNTSSDDFELEKNNDNSQCNDRSLDAENACAQAEKKNYKSGYHQASTKNIITNDDIIADYERYCEAFKNIYEPGVKPNADTNGSNYDSSGNRRIFSCDNDSISGEMVRSEKRRSDPETNQSNNLKRQRTKSLNSTVSKNL